MYLLRNVSGTAIPAKKLTPYVCELKQHRSRTELIIYLRKGIDKLTTVLTWDQGVRRIIRGITTFVRRLKQRRRKIHKLRR